MNAEAPSVRSLIESNRIWYQQRNKVLGNLERLLHSTIFYCTAMRIPIYRFPALSYLIYECFDFQQIINANDEKIYTWILEELFTGEVTLFEKIHELSVHRTNPLTENLYKKIEKYRRRIIKEGRTKPDAYVLEVDMVGSGRITGERKALVDRTDLKRYAFGVQKIAGIFTLFKRHIEKKKGKVFCEEGDAILAAFDNIKDAVYTACTLQREISGLREKGLEYRMGIGKGTFCIMNKVSRYSFSIVDAKRVTSKIKKTGILISQNCFCDLINCQKKQECSRERCSQANNQPLPITRTIQNELVKIMPRGPVELKHTTSQVFEIQADGFEVIL